MKVSSCVLSFLLWTSLSAIAQSLFVRISAVEFEGNRSLNTQQLRQLLQVSLEGNRYVAENLKADLQRVEQTYREEGFLNAKIGPPDVLIQTIGNSKNALIRIPVVEGSRYTLRGAAVRNAHALAPAALMQMCPMEKGQPYSRTKISQWQSKIEEAYRSMGFIRARCNVLETLHEIDKTAECIMECEEGKSYRVGKITLIADESIDRVQFKRRLLLSEGGNFDPEYLSLSIHFLNQMRIYRPISNSDVEIRIDDALGTVDLVWHIYLKEP
jgi:outer membrane protein insertion porin family